MFKKVTTMSDLNQNMINLVDIESVESPINVINKEKDGDELFLELEKLSENPESFLREHNNGDNSNGDSSSDMECEMFPSLTDYCIEKDDADLLNYFTGKIDSDKSDSNINTEAKSIKAAAKFTFVECPPDVLLGQKRRPGPKKVTTPSNNDNKQELDSKQPDFDDANLSKQAIQARENRQKKKRYVEGLEQSVSVLHSENATLKKDVVHLRDTVDSLKSEVQYLTNVLANQSTLSNLLKNIGATPGLDFKCTNFEKLVDASSEKVANTPQKRQRNDSLDEEEQIKENKLFNRSLVVTKSRSQSNKKTQKLDHDYASDVTVKSDSSLVSSKQKSIMGHKIIQITTTEADRRTAGICLHVSDKAVSLEFCEKCSSHASQ